MAKRRIKARKPPNATTLKKAWIGMDKAYGRFKKAERAVLALFYDAGHTDWDSFREAVKEAARDAHDAGRWTGFSNATIRDRFQEFDGSTH